MKPLPLLTMVTLGVAGLSAFPWQTLLGGILPLLVGIIPGNLDPECRAFFGKAAPPLIPFFAFALGSSLNLNRVVGSPLPENIIPLGGSAAAPVRREGH